MMKTLSLALTVIATTATAEPDRVSILFGSHHVDATVDFEETNPGLFLTWDNVTVGAFRNSYGNISASVTYEIPVWESDSTSLALFGGAAWYGDDAETFGVHVGEFVPIGGLQIVHDNYFMQVIPSDGVYTDVIVAFGVTFDNLRGH